MSRGSNGQSLSRGILTAFTYSISRKYNLSAGECQSDNSSQERQFPRDSLYEEITKSLVWQIHQQADEHPFGNSRLAKGLQDIIQLGRGRL
jgi:hypothetical protein